MKKLTIAVLIGFVFAVSAGTYSASAEFSLSPQGGEQKEITGFCFLFPSLSIAPAVEEDTEDAEEFSDDDGEVKIIVAEQDEPPEVRFRLLDWFKGVFLDS